MRTTGPTSQPSPGTQLRARKLAFEQGIPYETALDLVLMGDQFVSEVRSVRDSTATTKGRI